MKALDINGRQLIVGKSAIKLKESRLSGLEIQASHIPILINWLREAERELKAEAAKEQIRSLIEEHGVEVVKEVLSRFDGNCRGCLGDCESCTNG